jgi:hypothetical protein
MEVIKRISGTRAWIQVSDTEARLILFDKSKTISEMGKEGDKIAAKVARLKYLKAEIAKMKAQ